MPEMVVVQAQAGTGQVEVLSKAKGALLAALHVYLYAVIGFLFANMTAGWLGLGGSSDRPDLEAFQGLLYTALLSGVPALLALAYRYLQPDATAVPK